MAAAGIGPQGQIVTTRPRSFSPLMHAMADAAALDLRLRIYSDDRFSQQAARRLSQFISELFERRDPPDWYRKHGP